MDFSSITTTANDFTANETTAITTTTAIATITATATAGAKCFKPSDKLHTAD